MKLNVADIKVGSRMRKPDWPGVSKLADSIKAVGLLNPITVDKDLNLVAGFHRLEAFKLLGLDQIDAEIKDYTPLEAEMAEIAENLIRSDLDYLDKGEHAARYKHLYELKYPETKAGGDRKSEEFEAKRKDGVLKPSFAKDMSNKTGVSERTIQHDVQIATKLKPEVKKEIREISLPKNEALHLVRAVPKVEDQLAVLQKIKEKKARTVGEARKQVQVEHDIKKGERIEVTPDADFK